MSKLSAEQLAELKTAFEAIDANKDGVVSKEELSALLKGLGEDVGDDVVTEMMNLADTDGDGKVNFDEFCKAASSWNQQGLRTQSQLTSFHEGPKIILSLFCDGVFWHFLTWNLKL